MGMTCKLCSLDAQAVEQAFASGLSDRAVGRQFNVSAMAANRHRRLHLLRTAQDRVALLARDRPAREQRQELAAAVSAEEPSTQALVEATLGLRRQMEKLAGIEQRLERMATLAEAAQVPQAVATLSAQQMRGIETGAKLAGLTGFTPPAHATVEPGAAPVFSVNIIFSGGETEEITVVAGGSTTIDADADGLSDDDDNVAGGIAGD
jgi:hypothetical protein